MKLWEVLKALEENPKKKFKSINIQGDIENVLEVNDNGYFYLYRKERGGKKLKPNQPSGGFNGNMNICTDWQEVKQPVTWQEAFEEWLNGKTVFCFLENGKRVEYDQNINFIHAHSLKTGTWYIED